MWKHVLSLAISGSIACSLAACSSDREPTSEAPHASPAALAKLDLSSKAVASMSVDDLWQIGVRYLAWPPKMPSDVTKHEVHQRLLHAKYSGAGDFGVGDGDMGYDGADSPDGE